MGARSRKSGTCPSFSGARDSYSPDFIGPWLPRSLLSFSLFLLTGGMQIGRVGPGREFRPGQRRKRPGVPGGQAGRKGDKHHPAPGSRMLLPPCCCGRVIPMCFLVLSCVLPWSLEDQSSPPGLLPSQAPQGRPRRVWTGLQSQRWTLTKSFCLPQLFLGASNNLPGSLPAFRKQFALLEQCPAASSWFSFGSCGLSPLWAAFLDVCWVALGERRRLIFGPCSVCAT